MHYKIWLLLRADFSIETGAPCNVDYWESFEFEILLATIPLSLNNHLYH